MVKTVVLYGHPEDPAAFEEYYASTHMPIAARMSGVSRFEASRALPAPDGTPAPFYRVAELWFDSAEQMQATMGSPEGRATSADIANFATGGVTFMVAEVD